jgi:hypothetical protein
MYFRSRRPVNPAEYVMLNPQPLPPGGAVMLNPQPLPPRYLVSGIIIVGG